MNKIKCKCSNCGITLERMPYRLKYTKNVFCNNHGQCKREFYRKNPDCRAEKNDMDWADNILKLCEKYKLSEWADSLNLMIKNVDYQKMTRIEELKREW